MRVGEGYSTAEGPVVEGEASGRPDHIKRGTRSRPAFAPERAMDLRAQGQGARLGGRPAGNRRVTRHADLRSPNVVHSVEALPEEDLVFFTVKDLSHGIVGTPAG